MHKIHTLLAILQLLQYTEYQQDFFMLPRDPGLSLLLPLTSTKWTEAESLHSRNPFHYSPHCCFVQNCALLLFTSFLRMFTAASRAMYLPKVSAKLNPMVFKCLTTNWFTLLALSRNVKYYSSTWHSVQTFWYQYQSESTSWIWQLVWSKFKKMSISFSLSCNTVINWTASPSLSHCVSPLLHWFNPLISISVVTEILHVSGNVLISSVPSPCQE